MRIFAAYFWHTEQWTPRNEGILEAVLKRARARKHQWLVACDANMSPVDFEKGLWCRKDQMHVVAPEGASTCRSTSAKGEWVEKVYDYVIACNSLKGKISQMKVVEDFESRPHKPVSFVVERGKGDTGMERSEAVEGAAWLQWRKVARKEHKKRKAETKERWTRTARKEGSGGQIVQEVVAGIQERVRGKDGEKNDVKRPVEPCEAGTAHRLKMKKKTKAGEKGIKWQHSGMRGKKLEEILEHRTMEGRSLQWDVIRKVPELVVKERMSQGTRVKGFKEKKKVSGWSMEEMKEEPNISVGVDTEEMRKWRGLSQSEMDQCWKNWLKEWKRKF